MSIGVRLLFLCFRHEKTSKNFADALSMEVFEDEAFSFRSEAHQELVSSYRGHEEDEVTYQICKP